MYPSIELNVVAVPRLIAPTIDARSCVPIAMTSPSLAPTWNEIVVLPLNSAMPLNWAVVPMRAISDCSWLTSD